MTLPLTNDGKTRGARIPLIDAYLRKFRDAGLRVGVCLRPHHIQIGSSGQPVGHDTDSEEAYRELREDMQYAD